jgi:hypothetical protein
MRTFTKIREMLATHKYLKQKIEEMEKKYDYQFKVVFDTIKKLLEPPQTSRKKIGFQVKKRASFIKRKKAELVGTNGVRPKTTIQNPDTELVEVPLRKEEGMHKGTACRPTYSLINSFP